MSANERRKLTPDQAFRLLNLSDFIEPFNQRYLCLHLCYFLL